MEKKNPKNKELLSRREFLTKTAKGTLPILGVTLFGATLLSSCEPGDRYGCGTSCSGSCENDCSGNCDAGCHGSCFTGCHSSCYRGCTGY